MFRARVIHTVGHNSEDLNYDVLFLPHCMSRINKSDRYPYSKISVCIVMKIPRHCYQ